MPTPVVDDPPAGPPDTALLAAWADHGDERAFASLVERHVSLVHGVALRRLAADDAAREVTQTVFAIVARKAHSLRNVRVLAAWLHRVTSAQAARAIRQLVRDRRLHASAMQHACLTTGGRDPLADALPFLDEALDNLPERDRTLLMLRYSEGVSFSEAAARTGRGEAALRQQTVRAVDRLASALRRKGVIVPAATLTTGLAGVFTGGVRPAGAEIARRAVLSAPAIPAGTLILTSLLTMTAFKATFLAAGAALLLTGVPALWQGVKLSHLRRDAVSRTENAAPSAAGEDTSGKAIAGKSKSARPSGRKPAPLDMDAIGTAAEQSMEILMKEGAEKMAAVEARRTALATGMSADEEAALLRFISAMYIKEFADDEAGETGHGNEHGAEKENFQKKTRSRIEEYLTANGAPGQVEKWRAVQLQRQETEMEKIAADAFHATSRIVDLTPEQKDALFKKCSEQAREIYATNWMNQFSADGAVGPRPSEPLEADRTILKEILTSAQLQDWESHSTAQEAFYEQLPHRVMSRVLSVVRGDDLANAIQKEVSENE